MSHSNALAFGNAVEEEDLKLVAFAFEADTVAEGGGEDPVAEAVHDLSADVDFPGGGVGLKAGAGAAVVVAVKGGLVKCYKVFILAQTRISGAASVLKTGAAVDRQVDYARYGELRAEQAAVVLQSYGVTDGDALLGGEQLFDGGLIC